MSSGLQVSWSRNPGSYCMKPTSHILSPTCLIPTFWPADTVLKLIFRRLLQMQSFVYSASISH